MVDKDKRQGERLSSIAEDTIGSMVDDANPHASRRTRNNAQMGRIDSRLVGHVVS